MALAGSVLMLAGAAGAEKRQTYTAVNCGAYCLFVALQSLGIEDLRLSELEERLGEPSEQGFSFQDLAEAVKAYDAHAIPVAVDGDRLLSIDTRSVVPLVRFHENHFVLLGNVITDEDGQQGVAIIDPPGSYEMTPEQFGDSYDGNALLISRDEISISSLMPSQVRFGWIVGFCLGLALLLSAWRLKGRLTLNQLGRGAPIGVVIMLTLLSGCEHRSSPRAAHAVPSPRDLRFESPSVDLGRLSAGHIPVEHDITLYNDGPTAISVSAIRVSCGCTEATLAANPIPANSSTTLRVSVVPGDVGKHDATIRLETSMFGGETTNLHMGWYAIGTLKVSKSFFKFGKVSPDEALLESFNIEIDSPGINEMDVHVQSTSDRVSLVRGQMGRWDVILDPEVANGKQVAILNVSHLDEVVDRVFLEWEVASPVRVSPAESFVFDEIGPVRRSFFIECDSPTSAEAVEVRAASGSTRVLAAKRIGTQTIEILLEHSRLDESLGTDELEFSVGEAKQCAVAKLVYVAGEADSL